jgi:hypothetical protein
VRTVAVANDDVSEPVYESFEGAGTRLRQVPHATGWQAVFKKK